MIKIVNIVSIWVVPGLLGFVLIYGWRKGVPLFDTFVEGAQEGFTTVIRLIPYLVGMMVAIGLFRSSGAMEIIVSIVSPVLNIFNIPPEILPMAVMRPVSGGSSLAILTDILNTYGPDSLIGRMASTLMGSTDTTLYVLAVYFGAVGIRNTRHALSVGLIADLAGILAAVFFSLLFFA